MTVNHLPRRTFIKSGLAVSLATLLPLKTFSKPRPIPPGSEQEKLNKLLSTYGPELGSLPLQAGRKSNGHI